MNQKFQKLENRTDGQHLKSERRKKKLLTDKVKEEEKQKPLERLNLVSGMR